MVKKISPFVINFFLIVIAPLFLTLTYLRSPFAISENEKPIYHLIHDWPYAESWKREQNLPEGPQFLLEARISKKDYQCLLQNKETKKWSFIMTTTSCLEHRSINLKEHWRLEGFTLKKSTDEQITFDFNGERIEIDFLSMHSEKALREEGCEGDFDLVFQGGKMTEICSLGPCGREGGFACLKDDQILKISTTSCHEEFILENYFFCRTPLRPYCSGGEDILCL
jgi:hypothetical protein